MMTHHADPITDVVQQRTDGAALIYRLEGELRGVATPAVGPEGVSLVHDLEAEVVAGPLSGHHLTGLNRLTLRADGVGLVAGPSTIECAEGSLLIETRGCVISPADLAWPRPEAIPARAFEFPDHDYRVTGSALLRSTHPSYAHLDGTTASIEGWINFESGEVEVEARSM